MLSGGGDVIQMAFDFRQGRRFDLLAGVALASLALSACGGEGTGERGQTPRLGASAVVTPGDDESDSTSSAGGVFVRLENASEFDFDRLAAGVDDDDVSRELGALASGDLTPYYEVAYAYEYTYAHATSGPNAFLFWPADYLGGLFLDDGYYTYVLSATLADPPSTWPGPSGPGFEDYPRQFNGDIAMQLRRDPRPQ